MALRDLHLLSSPVLRERGKEIEEIDDDIRTLVRDLYDTMYAAEGIGLAANQIGLTKRVAVVDAEGNQILLVNPVILARSGKEKAEEGCLSIPEFFGDVERAVNITLETTKLDGTKQTLELSDLEARAVQHEIDHLDGILFLDHLSPLKRLLLLKKWKKIHKGDTSYIKEVTPAGAS